MKNRGSERFSRRKFMGIITSLPFLSLLTPTNDLFTLTKKAKTAPPTSRNLLKGKFEFFTPYQATVVEEVTSLIIPTDEDPGAREAGVVFQLDHIVAGSNTLKKRYTEGIEWLDYVAEDTSGKESFLDLNHDEKMKILEIADSGEFPREVRLFIKHRNVSMGRAFFNIIKRQTFDLFYTSHIGWKVVGYQGPPQWSGHLDYHKCS